MKEPNAITIDFLTPEPSGTKPTQFVHAVYPKKLLLSQLTVGLKKELDSFTAAAFARKSQDDGFVIGEPYKGSSDELSVDGA